MRQNFDGLNKVMAKDKISSPKSVLFINRKMNAFKMLQDQFLVFYKSAKGRIPLDALRYLPQSFGGSEMEMNEAIRKSLESKLGVKSENRAK